MLTYNYIVQKGGAGTERNLLKKFSSKLRSHWLVSQKVGGAGKHWPLAVLTKGIINYSKVVTLLK